MQIQTWPGGRLAGLRATLPALTQVPSDHYTYCGVNHDEPFELRNTLAELGIYPRSHKVCLAPQLGGSKQLALFEEGKLPSEVVRQHYDRSLPPAVYIYGLQGHELGGAGFLHSGGRVFLAPDVIPAYFNQRLRHDGHSLDEYQRGGLFRDDVSTIDLDGPVASVLHPNLVYGHFLLENTSEVASSLEIASSWNGISRRVAGTNCAMGEGNCRSLFLAGRNTTL